MNNIDNLPVDNVIGEIHRVTNVNKNDASKEEVKVADSLTKNKVTDAAELKEQNRDHLTANISPTQLEKVAQQLQDFVGDMNKGLEFLVDQDSGRDVIKVIDKNSGDLIKQYPSEEVLSLVAKLSEATGNFINTDV